MQARLNILRSTAQQLGSQFRHHQLKEFVPHRIEELASLVEQSKDETQREKRLIWAEETLASFERQLPIQNAYWKDRSVLDD